jgi:hypothetical protein
MYLVHAFRNCTSLTDVDMSEALKTFDAGAFMNCTALFSIKISPRITLSIQTHFVDAHDKGYS